MNDNENALGTILCVPENRNTDYREDIGCLCIPGDFFKEWESYRPFTSPMPIHLNLKHGQRCDWGCGPTTGTAEVIKVEENVEVPGEVLCTFKKEQ